MFNRILLSLGVVALLTLPAYADWFGDAVNNAVKNTGTKAVNESADAIYNGAKESASKKNTSTNNSNGDSGSSNSGNNNGTSTTTATNSGNATAGGSADIPNEAAYNKFDFVPGDKVIFFDDFSDTDVGEFPRKWTLEGSGGGGDPVEVVSYAGQNYLMGSGYTFLYIRLNKKGDMPEKFTVEYDVTFRDNDGRSNDYYFLMPDAKGWSYNNTIILGADNGKSAHSTPGFDFGKNNDTKIHHISISVNGTFVKAYIDNVRVINDPEALTRPIKQIGMGMKGYNGHPMFSNFRLAEGGKNIKSAINTDGKIVTHGILFDPGSDKIRPESTATLRMILDILNGDPNLKFSIEGHTDNQGSSSTSQPLSEKRAIAVKNWLIAKGIDAGRLQAKGWGESKPIDSNATKEGQANNRRVEFVKI